MWHADHRIGTDPDGFAVFGDQLGQTENECNEKFAAMTHLADAGSNRLIRGSGVRMVGRGADGFAVYGDGWSDHSL